VQRERDSFERTAVDVNTYEPGEEHAPHSHPDAEQVYYLIEGVMKAVVENQEYIVNAGEFVRIPRSKRHWFKNVGEGRMTYILIDTHLGDLKKGA
jgi:quercetin dioxygenase-like cupin family protein